MMKLKDIAKLCKAAQSINLYDVKQEDGTIRQWIGDGQAIYPVEEMPYLEMNHIETIFDLNEKQRNEFYLNHTNLPEFICVDETTRMEILIEPDIYNINYRGENLLPLKRGEHIILVQSKYIDPILNNSEVVRIFIRFSKNQTPFIVVKEGLFIKGIIFCTYAEYLNDMFLGAVTRLWDSIRADFYMKANVEGKTIQSGVDLANDEPETKELFDNEQTPPDESEGKGE